MQRQEQILVVGGFVRNLLLGRKVKDTDWVVVGMTEERFMELYPQAVPKGRFFPVMKFEGDEFAFARVERSTGPGYNDFEMKADPSITLEEDLLRRDLTVNTFALCPETGEIVCAPGAWDDLNNRVLRHTSQAFKEDPVRVFRLARFYSQFPEFTVAPETVEMARSMVDLLPLVDKERVWTETLKALGGRKPSNFFRLLKEMNALDFWFKEFANVVGVPAGPAEFHPEEDTFEHLMDVLDTCAERTFCKEARWAAVCHDLGKGVTDPNLWPAHHGHDKAGVEVVDTLCRRLGAGVSFRKAAVIASEEHMRFGRVHELRPGKAVNMMQRLTRFPGGLEEFLHVAKADGVSDHFVEMFRMATVPVLAVKLPKQFHNQGLKSREVLLNLRAHEWKRVKIDFLDELEDE